MACSPSELGRLSLVLPLLVKASRRGDSMPSGPVIWTEVWKVLVNYPGDLAQALEFSINEPDDLDKARERIGTA